MKRKYTNETYNDVLSIISSYGEIPTCKDISKKDIVSHIGKTYEDFFRRYLLGKHSQNLQYESLEELRIQLYRDITEYRKKQDGEVVLYILDYLLEELSEDIFEKEKMNMKIKKNIHGGIIVDKPFSVWVEKLILQGMDYQTLMTELGIKKIPYLKSVLYECSTTLGRILNIDTENEYKHKGLD